MIDLSHPLAVEDDNTYDPFAAFDLQMGAGAVSTGLYPAYAELRSKCPVHPVGELYEKLGFEGLSGDRGGVGKAVFTYRGVDQVLRNDSGFTVKRQDEANTALLGETILDMDEPEHMPLRMLVAEAFNPRAVESYADQLVAPIVKRHIDKFADRGHADLVAEFTFTFPVHVIAGLLGLPEEDLPLFHRRAIEIVISSSRARGVRATELLAKYLGGIVTQRRNDPRDDLVTTLINARLGERTLTDQEIIDFCRLLLPAGAETTYRSSSNLIFLLLRHPEQLAALTADRSLMRQAIEEGIRFQPPVTMVGRTALRDTTVEGVDIAAGTMLSLFLASTNRDPAHHERPDEFDIFRAPRPHLSFSRGVHTCLGAHLARMETEVALNALLDRLPGLRLDPSAEPVEIEGFVFRAPPRLPVVWDVAKI